MEGDGKRLASEKGGFFSSQAQGKDTYLLDVVRDEGL